MTNTKTPVLLVGARDRIIRYLANPIRRRELAERLVNGDIGRFGAYSEAVAAACPDLARDYYVDMVRAVLLAEKPRMIRSPRRVSA